MGKPPTLKRPNRNGWAQHLAKALKPRGTVVLILEAPAAGTADRFARDAKAVPEALGFATEIAAGHGMIGRRAVRQSPFLDSPAHPA